MTAMILKRIPPNEPLTVVERLAYGDDAERCPRTGVPFQRGYGAHPKEIQSRLYEAEIARGRPLTPLEAQQIVHGRLELVK
jgi:hypothetical protein